MEDVLIACPSCEISLRIHGQDVVGHQGLCPECGQRFLLRQPKQAESARADSSNGASPPVGTSARWVPNDDAIVSPVSNAAVPSPTVEEKSLDSGYTDFPDFTADSDPATTWRQLRRRSQKSRNLIIIIGLLGILMVGLVYYFAVRPYLSRRSEMHLPPQTDLPRFVQKNWRSDVSLLTTQASMDP